MALWNAGYIYDASAAPHAPGIRITSRGVLSSSVAVGISPSISNFANKARREESPKWEMRCSAATVMGTLRTFHPRCVSILELGLFDAPDTVWQRAKVLLVMKPEEVHPPG